MAATVDYLFGYDATADIVDDWMYEDIAQKYALDEESRRFLEQSNPWALRELTGRLIEAGFAVVSIDYRLAPETKLPAIIEDVEAAFDWIRGQGPDLFRADPDRLGRGPGPGHGSNRRRPRHPR